MNEPRPKRRWYRFLYQFSLRTLLVAITLAAVACWWFLQPQVQHEELAGKYLTLRRQVRVEPVREDSPPLARGSATSWLANIGSWQLRNEHGDLLVDGRYANDRPQGRWTAWHANGQKAVEGEVAGGLRTGEWRVWDEAGQLRSEVTYRIVEIVPEGLPAPNRPQPYSTDLIPVVGIASPLGQMDAISGGGLGGMLGGSSQPTGLEPLARPRIVSQRHGPARAWHANGQLQLEGQFESDLRVGLWTFYDKSGAIESRGKFVRGRREGLWTEKYKQSERYISGRREAAHAALLARLREDVASGDLARQIAAAAILETLGSEGTPLLILLFEQESDEARLVALRSLVRTNSIPVDLLPAMEPLIEHPDPRLSLRAMLAVYALQPSRREALLDRIMAALDRIDEVETHAQAVRLICRVDPGRGELAALRLLESLAKDAAADRYVGHWKWLLTLGVEPLPLLVQAFASPDRDVRLYALLAIEQLIESGEQPWEIPVEVQSLLERAKTDADPRVREAAAGVGNSDSYSAAGMGGMGGGFFCLPSP
jgi:antitoxin component YwqK of YwqJK toxin-antitoxin module